jgi:hypothetical protein
VVDFFEEVEEDLRVQRMRKLMRYAPWAGGVVAAVFLGWLGYWGWTVNVRQSVAQASVAYSKGLKALKDGDKVAADRAFADAEKPLAPGYKALALFQQAGIALTQNREADAVKDLDAAAKAAGSNQLLADLASLEAAYIKLDTASYAEMETRLKPLAEPSRPFHNQAKAALGAAQLKAGRVKDARATFDSLRFLATSDVQQLATAAVEAIDAGDTQRVLDMAKSSATLSSKPVIVPQSPTAGSPAPPAGAEAQ